MMRMIEGVSLKDHITRKSLLAKYNLPSVNQLAGEIKLIEAWKSTHIPDYPFKMEANKNVRPLTDRQLRPNSEKLWKDTARTKAGTESFSIDSAKLWNTIPDDIKNAPTIGIAKHAIKKFCKTLEL